jgi:hypothetical protein
MLGVVLYVIKPQTRGTLLFIGALLIAALVVILVLGRFGLVLGIIIIIVFVLWLFSRGKK